MSDVMIGLINSVATFLLRLPRSFKRFAAVLLDAAFCVLATWLAFYLRLDEYVKFNNDLVRPVLLSIVIALPIFAANGLYRAIFRYSGWPAVHTVGRAIFLYGAIYASILMAIGLDGTPRTTGMIQPLILFFAVSGWRVLARYFLDFRSSNSQLKNKASPALIYGAGSAGRQLATALNVSHEIKVVGFLDDDDRLHGHIVNDQPVYCPDDLGSLIESKSVSHVLMAIPSARRLRRNEILNYLSRYHLIVRTLPSVADLAHGRVTISDVRELDIDDLLGRQSVPPDQILLAKNISMRVVLVTGAGGSIGSELCRQIINLGPEKLLLIDSSEFALYAIHSELEGLCKASSDLNPLSIVPVLASVQDEGRMREIMDTWVPHTVYHAAAYKHVPLVEHNLVEGLKNNVIGTLITAQAAIEKGVSDFVLISTDKAVRPTNVMGASKRLAELCLQALFALQAQKPAKKGNKKTSQGILPTQTTKTTLSMVRFGNVLGSSGSVIPKFREQIRDGGPITLTHPEITRYFMTIPEAAQLVIQAGAMASGGDVFVLDMGESIKIIDLARRMIELSGCSVRNEANPDGDIEIVITGLRPGEKLHEELLMGDDPQPTLHPKIQRAQDSFIPWYELEKDLETLKTSVSHNNVEMILTMLQKLVAGYQLGAEVVDWVFREQVRQSNGTAEREKLEPASGPSQIH